MSETKSFPTLDVASCVCGVALTEGLTIARMSEISEHALGYPLWTHELTYDGLVENVENAIRTQLPLLPSAEHAAQNWQDAANVATKAYGASVDLARGSQARQENPLSTLRRVAGGVA